MVIKSKRKLKSTMNLWLEQTLFSTAVFCTLLEVGAQTYCEESPKILFYRRGQAALVSGSGSEQDNHVVISNVNKEFLACVSSRNVEWTYDGEGEPSKFQESSTVDIQKYEDGSISYCLTSQITFSNKQSDTELSRHTGRYRCREIGNNSNAVSAYVFASRKNSPTFLQSRKTITLPLSQENITLYPINPSPVVLGAVAYKNDAAVNLVFAIPCVTTHPNVNVKLYKKDKSNKFVVYNEGVNLFDPKYGFLVNISRKNSEDLSEFYGEYKCVSTSNSAARKGRAPEGGVAASNKMDVEDFVFITLVKAKSFQLYPPVTDVYTAGMLNLTCESDEPVIMKEVLPASAQDIYSYLDEDDYARDRSDDIVETTERTEQKSHIANYMEIAPAPGRSGEIQCLTEKDGKVLHTWKYRIIRKRAEKLSGIKFNKREKSFTCKSKLGAPGRLSFISCRTPSECRINKICLTKSENCRGYSNSTRAFCERKSHFCGKIFYKGGSGLIRCIGEGIDEIRGFTDEASADHAVRMGFGKLKASETALLRLAGVIAKDSKNDQPEKLQKDQVIQQKESAKLVNASKIYEGDQVNVTLQLGYYYFLYPVQWAVKFSNGSTIQIIPESQYLQVDRLARIVHASLTLPYTSATTFLKYNGTRDNSTAATIKEATDETRQEQFSEITALHALIPLRASVDPSWKTISLPLTVYGRKGLPQLVTDTESDELLIEQPLYVQTNATLSATLSDNDEVASDAKQKVIEKFANENDESDEEEEDDEVVQKKIDATISESIGQLAEKNNTTNDANKLPENKDAVVAQNHDSTSNKDNTELNDDVKNITAHTHNENSHPVNTTTTTEPTSDILQPEIQTEIPETMNLNMDDTFSEKPLLSLEETVLMSNESLANQSAPGHVTDADTKYTKITEANDDTEEMMIETEKDSQTLFLARSGLLAEDFSSGENINNENDDVEENSKERDEIVTTTELSRLVNVVNDENDSPTEQYLAEIETTSIPSIAG